MIEYDYVNDCLTYNLEEDWGLLMKTPEEIIQKEALEVITLEQKLADTERELMANEQFKQFLELQKYAQSKIAETWQHVEDLMIKHDVKKIVGDWGYITLVEKLGFDIDEEQLPRSYKKLVPDTKKIGDTYKLTGKLVKGTEAKTTKYLRKGLK